MREGSGRGGEVDSVPALKAVKRKGDGALSMASQRSGWKALAFGHRLRASANNNGNTVDKLQHIFKNNDAVLRRKKI